MTKLFWTTSSIFAACLLVLGCGDSHQNPLEKTIGIRGQSYCDETNQVFHQALSVHLVKTEADAQEMYTSSISMLMSALNQYGKDSDVKDVKNQVLKDGKADLTHLKDCSDLVALEQLRAKGLNNSKYQGSSSSSGSGSGSDQSASAKKDQPIIFHAFLSAFAHSLDGMSHYQYASGGGTSAQLYDFGARLDLSVPENFGTNPDSVEVFASRPESILKQGDKITEVQFLPPRNGGYPVTRTISQFLKDFGASGLESIFYFSTSDALKVKINSNKDWTDLKGLKIGGRIPFVQTKAMGSNVYVRLLQFEDGVADELMHAIISTRDQIVADQTKQGIKAQIGIILDLRLNGGGYASQGSQILNLFLGYGKVVETRDRSGVVEEAILPNKNAIFNEPLVVLVDRRSASESELVSMVLKETGRALIVGETTFGKGIGQVGLMPLNFLNGMLWVTAQYFYGPNGDSPQLTGVAPNVPTEDNKILAAVAACVKCPIRMKDLQASAPRSDWILPESHVGAHLQNTLVNPVKTSLDLVGFAPVTDKDDNILETGLKAIVKITGQVVPPAGPVATVPPPTTTATPTAPTAAAAAAKPS